MHLLEGGVLMNVYGRVLVPEDRIAVCSIDTDPLSLDPARCADYIGQMICQALYEPLYVRESPSGEWALGAAERHEVSEGGLVHTFHLRRDRRFSNGEPVTADDFVFAFRRLVDPKTASPVASLFSPLLHADPIMEGEMPAEQLGVTALDSWTLELRLAYRVPFLKALLASPHASPVSHAAWHAKGEAGILQVTNGPFRLVSHKRGEFVRLEANPHYPREPHAVEGLLFSICKDLHVPLARYREGAVHVTCNTYFPFDRLAQLSAYDDFHRLPSGILFLMQFNRKRHAALGDVRVRKVLYAAIDKGKLAQDLHGGLLPWNSFVTKGLRVEDRSLQWTSPTFASIETVPDMAELSDLTVLYADFYPNQEVVEGILAMWREHLGVRMHSEGVSFEEFARRVDEEDYDLCLNLITPTYADPFVCLQYYIPELDEAAADRFIERLEEALDAEEASRFSAYDRAEAVLHEELPALPLFNGQSLYLKQPCLRGYHLFPDGGVSFRRLSWCRPEKLDEEESE
jgi:oligopeptide transport system substrate-binding protein